MTKPADNTHSALPQLRKLCLSLPETTEVTAWGHPTFRVAGKIFVGFGQQAGRWCFGVKVGKTRQKGLLKDERFLFSDYVGKHGWVSLTLDHKLDWNEIGGLVLESYRNIAPEKVLAKLEGDSDAQSMAKPKKTRRKRSRTVRKH